VFINSSLRSDTAFVGEVGLLGELRPVHSLEKRISEARRMGFSRIVTPSSSSQKKKWGRHIISQVPAKPQQEVSSNSCVRTYSMLSIVA